MDKLIQENFYPLLLICAATLAFLALRDWQLARSAPDDQHRMPFSAKFLLIIMGGLIFVWLVNSIFGSSSGKTGFATVAGLILLGVAAVIGIMNFLSISASRIGIIDGRQPFGLPDGSVRAILTMAFIVLVGVLSAFLLTGNRDRTGYSEEGQVVVSGLVWTEANARAKELIATFGTNALISIEALPVEGLTPPAGSNGERTYKVAVHAKVDHTVSDDIAKQTLTMISTILAAMIGFYFASRGGAEGGDPAVAKRDKARSELAALLAGSQTDADLVAQRKLLDGLKAAVATSQNAKERQAMNEMLIAPEKSLHDLEAQWSQFKSLSERVDASFADIEAARNSLPDIKVRLERLKATLSEKSKQIATTTVPPDNG